MLDIQPLHGLMGRSRKHHKIIDGVELKHCSCCKNWLSLDSFSKNRLIWDALDRRCNGCKKRYAMKNKETLQQKGKEWFQKTQKERIKHRQKKIQIIMDENPELTDIDGYGGFYKILPNGRIFSLHSRKWLQRGCLREGYQTIGLRKKR